MNNISYDAICIVSNIFGTYILYKIMNIFYECREYNKKIELLSYALYCAITSCVQLLFAGTVISHAVYLVLIPFLTLNYIHDKKLRNKALTTVLSTYLIIESIAYLSKLLLDFINEDILILEISKMAAFFALIVLKKIIEKSREKKLLFGLMLFMPIGTSWLFYLIILATPILNVFSAGASLIIYLIDFSSFFLYEKIVANGGGVAFEELYGAELQDNLRLKRIVYEYQQECSTIQKDLKQNLYRVLGFIKNDEKDKALQCLKEIGNTKPHFFEEAYSGNKEIDNILNSRLTCAKLVGMEVKLKTILPKKLDEKLIEDLDIVLSNLIKSAIIESVEIDKSSRRIRIMMDYKENTIQLSIAYSCKREDSLSQDVCFYDANTNDEEEAKIFGLGEIIRVLGKYNTYLTVMNMDTSRDAYLAITVPYELAEI